METQHLHPTAPLAALVGLLRCPGDGGRLSLDGETVRCQSCSRTFEYRNGVVRLLDVEELDADDQREMTGRDTQAAWYDEIHGGYTDDVEVVPTVEALGACHAPVLEIGAGTGRMTPALVHASGQPVVAVDYSAGSLERLVQRCAGLPVLAVQADARALPFEDGAFDAVLAAELYPMFRETDRAALVQEIARVMSDDAEGVISTLQFNGVFRAWQLLGNRTARETEQIMGGDGYVIRLTAKEFRQELGAAFEIERMWGTRNVPARSIAGLVGRVGGAGVERRLMRLFEGPGVRFDRAVGRTPLVALSGLYLTAKVRKKR